MASSAAPSTALLLPLPDIIPHRDTGRKLRTVGHFLAHSPTRCLGLVAWGGTAVVVDLSLCVDGRGDDDGRGGWRHYRAQQVEGSSTARVFPPEIKMPVMCMGYLEAFDDDQELGYDFDMDLWVRAARLRSAFEWKDRENATDTASDDAKSEERGTDVGTASTVVRKRTMREEGAVAEREVIEISD